MINNFCSNCGNKLSKNENYCPNCGNKVNEERNDISLNKNINSIKKDIKSGKKIFSNSISSVKSNIESIKDGSKAKDKKTGDILRYSFGGLILLISLVFLSGKDTIISGLFLIIMGISLMPFVYNLLKKTKISKGLITFFAIVIPIISFFASIMLIPIDENANNIQNISNILDYYIAGLSKEKEIEVKKTDANDKYDVIIHYSMLDSDDYKAIGHYAIDYIERVKKAEFYDDIDPKILKYVFYFYKKSEKKFTIEYINSNSDKVEQVEIINNETKEKLIYTSADNQEYLNIISEMAKKREEEQKAKEQERKQQEEREKERQAQESRKKNTNVEHNVGETIVCPAFDITIDSFAIKKEGSKIDSYQVISDPEWIGVILTVKNTSSGERTFYSSDLKLQNSTGEIISNSFWNYNIWGVELLKSPKLIPGGIKTGYISFANTNQDNSNLKLLINCDDKLIGKDTKYIFNLK